MKDDESLCIFCKIIAGNAPASVVYEDESVMVFPPLHPINKGHLLIIPKKHAQYLADLEGDTAAHMMKVAKKLASAIRRSKYPSDGVNLFLADGEAAGQEVFHVHLHVYPRFEEDGFGFKYDEKKHFALMERSEIDKVAEEIRHQLRRGPSCL